MNLFLANGISLVATLYEYMTSYTSHGSQEDTKKKIQKIVFKMFDFIAAMAFSIGLIIAGTTLTAFPAATPAAVMARETIKLSFPYFAIFISSQIASRLLSQ
ncbi:MAG: hypothetical protein A3D96_03890 [Chlamydiae bacterium RIFCSPHIGHO2_12_FULL_44_59]|nr:MAG: hypothetical protein A2796_02575 [Chlamydiae bacterium RIFCSPHIGHO2_01_FULL_44_39]OGN58721.1 MAG: hypothetical protein A3C42_05655 [Chlamydiae bacterium RIFCSPHIGHO2_02_FULL_45_9]OGN59902.1 MAG: hypothetical protein A3D96_03890 [Chlamydiae bacterium RIFCSPHIGHO2_12_FULL_44_59]OGN66109.1 MAG: hypothetical protein A2978_04405 [Chlamydiae bacterium RIFCSPLOWO2_01_FULL_44_52]OGN68644.1 MAG: hypothetical protein A3I67_02730 [Chlamydiae bacterium RIFCSPLOWO2_02_FULL_45_22]OGN69757.1 MAG: hyp